MPYFSLKPRSRSPHDHPYVHIVFIPYVICSSSPDGRSCTSSGFASPGVITSSVLPILHLVSFVKTPLCLALFYVLAAYSTIPLRPLSFYFSLLRHHDPSSPNALMNRLILFPG
jgi:hypothetical protein